MIFNEFTYYFILFLTLLFYYIVPNGYRWLVLTLFGLIFYYVYGGNPVFLFIIESFLVYIFIKDTRNKFYFFLILLIPLSLLFYFKYKSMFFAAFGLSKAINNPANYIIPLGISFFTFEFVHCIVDRKKGRIENLNPKDYAAFIMFFPTMVSGPIKRYQQFNHQFSSSFSFENMYIGLARITKGLAKKIILADNFSLIADRLTAADFSSHWVHYPKELWIGIIAYSFKIYYDFSGYSDIAIGSAKLFGINVPENFNSPYLKTNIGLFWKNWHISLYKWLVDYIFIPLGGSKVILLFILLNTCFVMMISGLWHGAQWHFVAWGLYNGILLVLYRLYRYFIVEKYSLMQRAWYNSLPVKAVSILITFILVSLGWVLFVCDFDRAAAVYKAIFLIKGA
ncbi:MAG: MBOAT family protein [Candidatus Omnitrophica bacterium]|nr:MBOAT family protein [Candidatus Omnitrophota bacterium]